MPHYMISPAEPPVIRAMGTVNSLPERMGADILWAEPQVAGMIGIQRKTVTDLFASLGQSERLYKEMEQLRQCKLAWVIVEGRPRWNPDGSMMGDKWSRWTRKSYRGVIRSIQNKGVFVEHSDDEADTITLVEEIASWVAKGDHDSLDRRPKPVNTSWGSDIGEEGWACHLLQSFDGIGPKQAKAIYDHFGGRVPLTLTCTLEELEGVPMIGPKKAANIGRVFGIVPAEKIARSKKSA